MRNHLFSAIFATSFGIFAPSAIVLLPVQPTTQSIAQADNAEAVQQDNAQQDNTQSIESIAQQFVELAAAGDFTAAHQLLHPSLQESWSPTQMESQWNDLQKAVGSFESILQSEVTGNSLVLVKTKFGRVTDDILVIFEDSQPGIVGVDFPEQFDRTAP